MFETGLGLERTHVLVTGANGAIGGVVVEAFLAAGAYVSAFDIKESATAVQHERLFSLLVDVTDELGLESAMDAARAKFGVISTCMAAAGVDLSYSLQCSLTDMPLDEWRRIMRTHKISAVVFGSEAGRFGVTLCSPYATSKAAIQIGLVRSLARDEVGVNPRCRVNAVAPGAVNTQFRKECAADAAALWREAHATTALKTPVEIDVVARACLFLASDAFAGNITGQVLPVDSGKTGTLQWLGNGLQA